MFSQSHFFLNTGGRELQYLNYLKFFFDKPEGFVARSVYNQKTRYLDLKILELEIERKDA